MLLFRGWVVVGWCHLGWWGIEFTAIPLSFPLSSYTHTCTPPTPNTHTQKHPPQTQQNTKLETLKRIEQSLCERPQGYEGASRGRHWVLVSVCVREGRGVVVLCMVHVHVSPVHARLM